jgi:glycosyltransferase involved in cell wall biosynthesis
VVGQAQGELLGAVPAGAGTVELGKVALMRARLQVLAADPASWKLVLQPKGGMGMLKRLLRRLPPLIAYLRRARPDAVLAAEPRYNVLAVWGRRLSGLGGRVVISERIQASHHAASGGPWGNQGPSGLLRSAYLAADAIVAVSDGVADDLASHADLPREKITTVYNPVVGPELELRAREPLDHPWFAPGAAPVILAAGRLDPQKDFATLLRAFAQVRARRPARLLILGAPSLAAPGHAGELAALADNLGIAADVAMPGFADNPFAFMARAAVFVLSSRYEGLPGVLIQALACGCPVVSTDCPSGPAEVLEGGRLGPLVAVGDAAGMAAAIERLLDHPPPRADLEAGARRFEVERSVDRYLDLLLPARV